jgi:hypothetical protein
VPALPLSVESSPVGAAVIEAPSSTVIDFARMVRLPVGELSVAPERTMTAPETTISPSLSLVVVTSSEGSTHVEVVPSQLPVHVSVTVHVVPAASQVSTLPVLQRFAPGVHAPVHRPPLQPIAQVAVYRYAVPLALQTSTARPLQRYVPAVHVTVVVHAPALQPNEHGAVSVQVPLVQVSTLPVAPQRFAPSVHVRQTPAPVHVPPPAHAAAGDQSKQPLACFSQVCVDELLPAAHRFAPLVQASVQVSAHAPAEQTIGAVHATGVDQSVHPDDFFSQVWTPLPEHCFAPSVQTSVHVAAHAPAEHTVPPGQATGAENTSQPPDETHVLTASPSQTFTPIEQGAGHASPESVGLVSPPVAVSLFPVSLVAVSPPGFVSPPPSGFFVSPPAASSDGAPVSSSVPSVSAPMLESGVPPEGVSADPDAHPDPDTAISANESADSE